ncbi:transposase [Patescibacteria group bacterium]|nr:transposase [Patescibacteria group bacterium]
MRKVIYTTNAVEAVHRQFRKVTKSKSIFSNDDAWEKMLFLAYRDISKKWDVMPVQNWTLALSHLSIIFDERLQNVL